MKGGINGKVRADSPGVPRCHHPWTELVTSGRGVGAAGTCGSRKHMNKCKQRRGVNTERGRYGKRGNVGVLKVDASAERPALQEGLS